MSIQIVLCFIYLILTEINTRNFVNVGSERPRIFALSANSDQYCLDLVVSSIIEKKMESQVQIDRASEQNDKLETALELASYNGSSDDLVTVLAKVFQVSQQSMETRIGFLA